MQQISNCTLDTTDKNAFNSIPVAAEQRKKFISGESRVENSSGMSEQSSSFWVIMGGNYHDHCTIFLSSTFIVSWIFYDEFRNAKCVKQMLKSNFSLQIFSRLVQDFFSASCFQLIMKYLSWLHDRFPWLFDT